MSLAEILSHSGIFLSRKVSIIRAPLFAKCAKEKYKQMHYEGRLK